MFQRPSPIATLVVALTLCLLPVAAPADAGAAGPRIRVTQAQTAESRLLDRLERWHTALWKDVMSLWGKAGARIDDNGKS